MAQLFEYAKMALKNIMSNKMRSLLTMLGIIIGIGAVIVVLTVGSGAEASMNEQFESINNGSVTLSLNRRNAVAGDAFTPQDMESIKENILEIKAVSASVSRSGSTYLDGEKYDVSITGGSSDIFVTSNPTLVSGRFWNEDDYNAAQNVCTIDETAAAELFGSQDVLGLTIDVEIDNRNVSFRIIGVEEASTMMFGGDVTVRLSVPMTALMKYNDTIGKSFSSIVIMPHDKDLGGTVGNIAMNLISSRRDNKDRNVYNMMDMSQFQDQLNSVIGMFTGVIAAIAAISLLVGGIGVMNIMLVSVTERTREIGIRKALGAKTRSILFQFLIESSVLTLIGGAIGTAFGVLGGYAVCSLLDVKASVNPTTIAIVVLFSSAIGLFFGIYPAHKASNLSPIEALRTE